LLKVLLFVDDNPILTKISTTNDDWTLHDDEYMSDEMLILASNERWRDWTQQIQMGDNDFNDVRSTFSDTSTSQSMNGQENGDGFGQLLKSIAEILLAILSFTLNILVEIMV